MNEVLKTIQDRISTRGYTGEPLPKEKLDHIIKAGLQAPSAKDSQHWEFIVIQNKQLIEDLNTSALEVLSNQEDKSIYQRVMDRGGDMYYNAPVMVLVLKPPHPHPWADVDCGIVIQNMALAATSIDVDNIIVAMANIPFSEKSPKANDFKKAVGWKEGYTFGMAILLGDGTVTKDPHDIHFEKVSYVN